MWANEFVRLTLWQEGQWQAAGLEDHVLDTAIADRMSAQSDVRIKCRNNYRHLFELCAYWPAKLGTINSMADEFLGQALFLSWDRLVLDNGGQSAVALADYARGQELHKLLGVPEELVLDQVPRVASLYLQLSGLQRFSAPPAAPPELNEETDLTWLDEEEVGQAVGRRSTEIQAQIRNRRKAAALRRRYDNTCMFCGTKLSIGEREFYSEAAHIQAIGKPHNGPDKVGNMIVLCPNHHLQFDRGVLRIKREGETYRVVSRIEGDKLHAKPIQLKHALDDACIEWHFNWFDLGRL